MSMTRVRYLSVGLVVGLTIASTVEAQDPLTLLPPLPSTAPLAAGRVVQEGPIFIPAPAVVLVSPGGPSPSWAAGRIDPIALARHPAKHVERKACSWYWRRLQGKLLGYPEEFEPRPLGASLYDNGRTMVANGAAARLVLFNYDFVGNTSRLNARGRDQVAKAALQLAASPYPLLIERTPDTPGLAEARRATVLNELAGGSIPIDPGRVLVGMPSPSGMAGNEAVFVQYNALTRTQQYGPAIPLISNGLNSPSGVTVSTVILQSQ